MPKKQHNHIQTIVIDGNSIRNIEDLPNYLPFRLSVMRVLNGNRNEVSDPEWSNKLYARYGYNRNTINAIIQNNTIIRNRDVLTILIINELGKDPKVTYDSEQQYIEIQRIIDQYVQNQMQ